MGRLLPGLPVFLSLKWIHRRSRWSTATDTSAVCCCLHCTWLLSAERLQPAERTTLKALRNSSMTAISLHLLTQDLYWIPVLLPGSEGGLCWFSVHLNMYLIVLKVELEEYKTMNDLMVPLLPFKVFDLHNWSLLHAYKNFRHFIPVISLHTIQIRK